MAQAQVIDFGRLRKTPTKGRPFGTIRTRKHGKLEIRFNYLGKIVYERTGLDDTPENRERVRAFLNRMDAAINDGSFVYAEWFPGASPKKKQRYSRLEGREAPIQPGQLTFGEHIKCWIPKTLEKFASPTKRRDYLSVIDHHILPRLSEFTFLEFTGIELVAFVESVKEHKLCGCGPMSASRLRNIVGILRTIWSDAVVGHNWDLRDPFQYLAHRNRHRDIIPRRTKSSPVTFRLHEWKALLAHMHPHYQPICELMLMTGMIFSELKRLTLKDVHVSQIQVHGTKTQYRERTLPITRTLRPHLDTLIGRRHNDFLATWEDGTPWAETKEVPTRFRDRAWTKALKAAGLPHRKPYAMRHTFAAWNLLLGVLPDRMVRLMGHGSREMIFETYGRYVDGLEEDVDGIREYLVGATTKVGGVSGDV